MRGRGFGLLLGRRLGGGRRVLIRGRLCLRLRKQHLTVVCARHGARGTGGRNHHNNGQRRQPFETHMANLICLVDGDRI
jgi:hypothetical protein